MKTIALAAALAFTAVLPAAAQTGPAPFAAPCSVSVQFGSYAMGIDGKSFERVERYVARNTRLVSGSRVDRWGREGERTVCITTRSRGATSRVFADIKSLIRHRAERGPTEVKTLDGRVWRATPRAG